MATPPALGGTFTGFLKSLAELDVSLIIKNDINSTTIVAQRWGKTSQVVLSRRRIIDADSDIASVELGEVLSAVL